MSGEVEGSTGPVSLLTIGRQWGRIGVTGFGGPPAHIALLRTLCVAKRGWLSPQDFEDGIAAVSGVLAVALVWLVVLRKSIVLGLLGAGLLGVVAGFAGAPLPR